MKEQGQPKWQNVIKIPKIVKYFSVISCILVSQSSLAEQKIDWQQAKNAADIHITRQQIEQIKEKKLTAALD